MTNFFIIRNKEKNMYYFGDGSWTKIKDCARKHQHKDCAEVLMQKDNLDYKNCEIVEIPSITDLEAKLADRKQFCESQVKSLTDIIAGLIETKHNLEAKLAESKRKYEVLYKLFSEQHEIIDQMELECFEEVNRLLKEQKDFYIVEKTEYEKMKQVAKEIVNELKQQLAEKENELAIFKKRDIENQKHSERQINALKHNLIRKSQNQTAIAELEKVKELIKKHYKKQFPDFPLGVTEKTHINIIDQQISNLKGDK